MLLSPRKNGLDSLFEEVRVFKVEMEGSNSPRTCKEEARQKEQEE